MGRQPPDQLTAQQQNALFLTGIGMPGANLSLVNPQRVLVPQNPNQPSLLLLADQGSSSSGFSSLIS